jgi:hypothetical protein
MYLSLLLRAGDCVASARRGLPFGRKIYLLTYFKERDIVKRHPTLYLCLAAASSAIVLRRAVLWRTVENQTRSNRDAAWGVGEARERNVL